MNAVSFFSDFLARAREKMDPDKSVVFSYDGVPAHLGLPYASPPLDIAEKVLSESDTYGRYLESGNWNMCMYNRNEGKALAIPVAEVGHNICSAWSSA